MKSVDYLIVSYNTLPLRRPRSYQIEKLLKHLKGSYYLITCDCTSAELLDFSLNSYSTKDKTNTLRIHDSSINLSFKLLLKFLPFLGQYPDKFWLWERSVVQHSKVLSKKLKPKAIIAFARPMRDLLIGIKLKNIFNIPLVVHFADPWVDNPFHSYNRFTKRINSLLEARVINNADLILFTNTDQKDLVMRKYPKSLREKATSIAHCYDEKLYCHRPKQTDNFVIKHIGNLYKQRSAEAFFKAIHLLRENHIDVSEKTVIEFYGDISDDVRTIIKKYSLEDIVKIKSYVPYLESLNQMADSDLLLLIDAESSHNTFFPSKLADYIGTKNNILGITSHTGPSAKIIKAYGGMAFSHNQVDEIKDYLIYAINHHEVFKPNKKEMMKYSAPVVAAEFEKLVQHVLA